MIFSCRDCQQPFPIDQLCVCKKNKEEKEIDKLLKLLVCEKCAKEHKGIGEELHSKNAKRLMVTVATDSSEHFLETFMARIRVILTQLEGVAENMEKKLRNQQVELEDWNGEKIVLESLLKTQKKADALLGNLKELNRMAVRGNIPELVQQIEKETIDDSIQQRDPNYDRKELYDIRGRKTCVDEQTQFTLTRLNLWAEGEKKGKVKSNLKNDEKEKNGILIGSTKKGNKKKTRNGNGNGASPHPNSPSPTQQLSFEPAPLPPLPKTNPWSRAPKSTSPLDLSSIRENNNNDGLERSPKSTIYTPSNPSLHSFEPRHSPMMFPGPFMQLHPQFLFEHPAAWQEPLIPQTNYDYDRPEYLREHRRGILDPSSLNVTAMSFNGESLEFNLINRTLSPMLVHFKGWEPRGSGVKIRYPGSDRLDEGGKYKLKFELLPNKATHVSVDFSQAIHVLDYYAQQNSSEYFAFVHLSAKGRLDQTGHFALAYATVCLKYSYGKWFTEWGPTRPTNHFRLKD